MPFFFFLAFYVVFLYYHTTACESLYFFSNVHLPVMIQRHTILYHIPKHFMWNILSISALSEQPLLRSCPYALLTFELFLRYSYLSNILHILHSNMVSLGFSVIV